MFLQHVKDFELTVLHSHVQNVVLILANVTNGLGKLVNDFLNDFDDS